MIFKNLDHLFAKLCVLDQEVDGFLAQTILAALVPHLLSAEIYLPIVAKISETK